MAWALPEHADDGSPRGIGEGVKDFAEIDFIFNHSFKDRGIALSVNTAPLKITLPRHAMQAEYRRSLLTNVSKDVTLNNMVELKPQALDTLFRALSNDTRREIIGLLARRPYKITELAPRSDMSLAAVSRHVKMLEQAGLIDRRVTGRDHVCRLNAKALGPAYAWLGAYETFWHERLDTLERVLRDRQGETNGIRKK